MLLLLGATSVASAGDVAALVAALLSARDRGALGSIDGRAYAEGRRGVVEATPYASVSVLVLPRSAEFEAQLEAIKAHSRNSLDAYIEAEPKVSAARQVFKRGLIDTGAGQLIFRESSDGAGAFRFQRVPEGAWTLLAWRETPHAKRPPRSQAERDRAPQGAPSGLRADDRGLLVQACHREDGRGGGGAAPRPQRVADGDQGGRSRCRPGSAGHSEDAAGRRPPLEERHPGSL